MRTSDGCGIKEESYRKSYEEGIMEEEPLCGKHERGILGKESWRTNHGGEVIEKESWRGHLGSVIMEASRRNLETARNLQEEPAWHSESHRRHPGGRLKQVWGLNIYIYIYIYIYI